MWGPYLVHQRILMLDKQIEKDVEYFTQHIDKSDCSYRNKVSA